MDDAPELSLPFVDSGAVDFFTPDNLTTDSPTDELRARLLVLSLFVMVAWGLPMAVFFFAIGYPFVGALSLVLSASNILPLFLARKSSRFEAIGHYICSVTLLALVMISVSSGGMKSLAVYWLIVPPLYAYVFVGRRAALGWTIASVAGMICVGILDGLGYGAGSRIPEGLREPVVFVSASTLVVLVYLILAINGRIREWAERSLEQTQRRVLDATREGFHRFVENTPDGVLVCRNGVVEYANPAGCEQLAARSVSEIQNRPVDDILSASGDGRVEEDKEGGAAPGEETFVRRVDGTEFPAEITRFVAPIDGKESQVVVMRDLTERRELRAQMMQLDRMAAVGTLAAGVGHEINNPLAFIMGNLEYLASVFDDHSGRAGDADLDLDEVQDALSDALDGAERIRHIVADLRSFSRDDHLALAATDVRESIESAVKMASNEIRHRATLVRDYHDVPDVLADDARLGQIVLNLLINAAHAVSERPVGEDTITVRTRYEDGAVRFSVSDTGIGMDEDTRARIFDPFFTTKSPGDGTGMGLAVCQNIVHELGGTIAVESAPGEGSTFTVSLPPYSEEGQILEGRYESEALDIRQTSVLVVDDEPAVCRMLERNLQGALEVHVFGSVDEALDALDGGLEVDVVLTDLLMPEESGVSFYGRLSESYPELADHVVFMTGGAFTDAAQAFVQQTDATVLRKPFDTDELVTALDNAAPTDGLSAAS